MKPGETQTSTQKSDCDEKMRDEYDYQTNLDW